MYRCLFHNICFFRCPIVNLQNREYKEQATEWKIQNIVVCQPGCLQHMSFWNSSCVSSVFAVVLVFCLFVVVCYSTCSVPLQLLLSSSCISSNREARWPVVCYSMFVNSNLHLFVTQLLLCSVLLQLYVQHWRGQIAGCAINPIPI